MDQHTLDEHALRTEIIQAARSMSGLGISQGTSGKNKEQG